MRILVLAVGRLRPPYVDDVQHYQRLLAGLARVELIEVRENEQAVARVPERAYVCLLHHEGRTLDSVEFSRFLEERRMEGRELCFVIGGPAGPRPRSLSTRSCRCGPMTLPHQLARVVLLEQLLRGHKILAGEPYHY